MSERPTRPILEIWWVGLLAFWSLSSLACEARVAAGQARRATPQPVAERNLGVRDIGIFSDLDAQVQIALPNRLERARIRGVLDQPRGQLVVYEGDRPLKVYPVGVGSEILQLGATPLPLRPGDRAELLPLLAAERMRIVTQPTAAAPGDLDGDGIPDPLDVLIGAHKTALNADRYDGRYLNLSYPLGDVPRTIGVCTDVIVRALRNAGLDLQRAVHEDIALAPRAYPMVQRANPSIDHRRVKSVLPYFERYFEPHTPRSDDPGDPLRAGDIVFMDTFPSRPGAEHVGIVSEQEGEPGIPLIINNWTDGSVTRAMKLLPWVPVTQRFRTPTPSLTLTTNSPIPPQTTQLLLVLASGWDSMRAELTRYARAPGAAWHAVGQPRPAMIGYGGYGWGDGLHGSGAPSGRTGPLKREGDGRSPAGVFTLGALHGYAAEPPPGSKLPYQAASDDQRCVDDPASPLYNRIILAHKEGASFRTAEHMKRDDEVYSLAIDVNHNRAPVMPGHGSCIFVHVWASPDKPVTGCTALAKTDLAELAIWLEPEAVMVALPRAEYQALRSTWGLP